MARVIADVRPQKTHRSESRDQVRRWRTSPYQASAVMSLWCRRSRTRPPGWHCRPTALRLFYLPTQGRHSRFRVQYGYNVGCLEVINPYLLPEVQVNDGINHPADRKG